MRVFTGLAAVVLLVVGVGGAAADKMTPAEAKAQALLKQAADATKAKDGEKGTQAITELAALASQQKSLSIEERAAGAFENLLDALADDSSASGGTAATVGRRSALAIVMKALEAGRHGLFLSAHGMAGELVLRAIEVGDSAHLDDALAVLTAYAGSPKCGKSGPALLKLAQGVKAARTSDAKALAALETAAAALREGRWARPALGCALERVTLHMNAGDLLNAGKVAQEAVGSLSPETDSSIANTWSAAVRKRLPDLPEAIKAALDAALAPVLKGGSEGAAGGRGGNAVDGPSPLGKSWSRLAADKAFVSVKRAPAGYEIRAAHDKKLAVTQPYKAMQRVWDQDGLTLSFVDGAVALCMLDMVGNRGQPGERSQASPAWAWYLLGPGETYAASANGVVITGP